MEKKSTITFQDAFWKDWNQVETFRHRTAVDLVTDGPVLDIGSGDGFFLAMLKKRKGIDGIGADLSEEAAKKASERGINVRVMDASAERLSFDDGAFPTAVMLDVLEHLFDPTFLLKEAVRISARHVIISVPNFCSLPARLQVLRGRVPENNKPRKGHIFWYTHAVLMRQLHEAGLKTVEVRVNANYATRPVLGRFFALAARLFPSVFALSFVIKAEKS